MRALACAASLLRRAAATIAPRPPLGTGGPLPAKHLWSIGVHDEAKDKAFDLELSWICDESNRQHQKVPDDLLEPAKAAARAALEEMDAV